MARPIPHLNDSVRAHRFATALVGKAQALLHGLGPVGRPSTCAVTRWGLLSDTTNNLDGRRRHLIFENRMPVAFLTRREARAYAEKRFGYVRRRPDLRGEPHCCRVPRPVRIRIGEAT